MTTKTPQQPEADAQSSSLRQALESSGGKKARTLADAARAAAEREYLCFKLHERKYAVPIEQVAEVLAPTTATEVPHLPAHIRGVFNRHGIVTTILDLAVFSGTDLEDKPKRLVVLEAGELVAAVPVTEVVGIVSVGADKIEPPLPHLAHELGFVVGQLNIDESVMSVLDSSILLAASRNERGSARA